MSKVSSATKTNPGSGETDSAKAWDQAEKDAKAVGINWEKPADDKRTADEIMDKTSIDNVAKRKIETADGKRKTVEEVLKDKVGDYEKDEDAAYRAAQILEHIEQFDGEGKRIASKDIDNGKVDGFSSQGDAYNNTEAGRLQDFGKYGFTNLKGKLNDVTSAVDDPDARKKAEDLGIKWERPEGDDRSAKDIIEKNDVLKNLGNQSDVRDMLKERVGDFEKDADAAYRAVQVLQHVEQLDGDGKRLAGNEVGDGKINEFKDSGEAVRGTEAGRLQDFGKHGFDSLKGKLTNPDNIGDDKTAREEAEKAGIKWELPDSDKRSAKDIIEDNPMLKNLGNQSNVKDMLKERVGDFEKDANAAYRAIQVLDRVVMYDENGKAFPYQDQKNANDPSDGKINGFSNSDQAYNGTEAGRLQDFGKHGFSALSTPGKTEDIPSYKDFLSKNKDADETAKTLAKYGAVLEENFELIKNKTGAEKPTIDDLKQYVKENPQIDGDLKEALNFWTQKGSFQALETSKDPLKYAPDGKLSKDDVSNWVKNHAPKDAGSAIEFLSSAINGSAVGEVDTSKLNADVFKKDSKNTTEEKAAALQELLKAQQLVMAGADAGMWSDDYGKVAIGTNPDPKEVLKDLNGKISILESDPKVVEYLKERSAKNTEKLFEENKGLKDAVQSTYDDQIKTGKLLDGLWEKNTKNGKTDQRSALAGFYSTASVYNDILGVKDGQSVIQDAVGSSKHADDLKTFYKDSMASGKRLEELMKDQTFEEAISTFATETALYNASLDPEFTGKLDKDLNDNFSRIANENTLKDGSFGDLKKVFGINGGDTLDEEKLLPILEEFVKNNPDLVTNADGKKATAGDILTGIRGSWDVMRQGTKALADMPATWIDKATTQGMLNPDLKVMADKGVLHAVSGVFMAGVTIAKGAQSGGNLKDKPLADVIAGSIQSATLLTEGGIKAYKDRMTDAIASDAKLDNPTTEEGKNLKAKITETQNKYLDDMPQVGDSLIKKEVLEDAKLDEPKTEAGKREKARRDAILEDAKHDEPQTREGRDLKTRRDEILEDIKKDKPETDLGKELKDKIKSTQKTYLTDNTFKNWNKAENVAKGIGGLAGAAVGAYSIFDGVQAIRRGDLVTGGINITAGSLGSLASLASAAEAGAAFSSASWAASTRAIMAPLAGGLGLAAAGIGIIAAFLPGLIEEGKKQTRQTNFANLLDEYLPKYDVDGVINGTPDDLPEEVWGKTTDGMS